MDKQRIADTIITLCTCVVNENKRFEELDNLINTYYKDEDICDLVFQNTFIKDNLLKLNEKMQEYERNFEDEFALKFIKMKDAEANGYIEKYKPMVVSEGNLADLKKGANVIILGGGSLPLTAITYVKTFNVTCTCIDIDQNAIFTSKKLIKHLNLEKEIHIEYGNAFNFPLKDYDLILVVCLLPKKPALQHVFAENKSAKVIYRSAVGLFKLWYGITNEKELSDYTIAKKINTNKEFAAESVLVQYH
ncbi:MAG: nicotianamine synthase family protein [Patescibacteria group bacterium]